MTREWEGVCEGLPRTVHKLTLSAVVRSEARVVALVREVGDEDQTEVVPRGGDDLGSRHCLRICCYLPTVERQQFPICLYLHKEGVEGQGISDFNSFIMLDKLKCCSEP